MSQDKGKQDEGSAGSYRWDSKSGIMGNLAGLGFSALADAPAFASVVAKGLSNTSNHVSDFNRASKELREGEQKWQERWAYLDNKGVDLKLDKSMNVARSGPFFELAFPPVVEDLDPVRKGTLLTRGYLFLRNNDVSPFNIFEYTHDGVSNDQDYFMRPDFAKLTPDMLYPNRVNLPNPSSSQTASSRQKPSFLDSLVDFGKAVAQTAKKVDSDARYTESFISDPEKVKKDIDKRAKELEKRPNVSYRNYSSYVRATNYGPRYAEVQAPSMMHIPGQGKFVKIDPEVLMVDFKHGLVWSRFNHSDNRRTDFF